MMCNVTIISMAAWLVTPSTSLKKQVISVPGGIKALQNHSWKMLIIQVVISPSLFLILLAYFYVNRGAIGSITAYIYFDVYIDVSLTAPDPTSPGPTQCYRRHAWLVWATETFLINTHQ